MAKIDTTKIPGYASMTVEQKLAALEAYETAEDSEIERYKNAASRANSEAAAYKKQLNDEKGNSATYETRIADLESKLAEAEKREKITSLTAKFVSLGYDSVLAAETAQAYANGNDDVVFANAAKANEAISQKLREEIQRGTARPAAGTPPKQYTLEEFRKLTAHERAVFASEHPEEYKAIYNGN